jgi:hypothetical protein
VTLAASLPNIPEQQEISHKDCVDLLRLLQFYSWISSEQERGNTLPKYRLKWLIATRTFCRTKVNLATIFVLFPYLSLDQRGVNQILRQIDDVFLAFGEIDQFFVVRDARQSLRADTRVCEAVSFGPLRERSLGT